MSFSITIDELEVWARVGVSEEEISWPQRLLVSVTLPAPAPREDDISTALNYSKIVETINITVQKTRHRLLETLAQTLFQAINDAHNTRPEIIVIKKFVIPSCRAVVVTLRSSP